MESVFVQTSRIRLHALRNRTADPARPLLLFLHGFPENAYSWRRQLLYFQDRFTVVALDMRGFGESDAPEGREHYSVDLLALDVLAVIKACGYESCVLIGHDWGGMVAWNVAANYIELPTKLEDNLAFENKKDHLWHMDFDDEKNKLLISKKIQYFEPVLTVSTIKKLNGVFRSSLVLELIWEDTIDYKINKDIKNTIKKISLLNLLKKYFSKRLRMFFK